MKILQTYGVFYVPTKEARLFAGLKSEILEEFFNIEEAMQYASDCNMGCILDDLHIGYKVYNMFKPCRPIGTVSMEILRTLNLNRYKKIQITSGKTKDTKIYNLTGGKISNPDEISNWFMEQLSSGKNPNISIYIY